MKNLPFVVLGIVAVTWWVGMAWVFSQPDKDATPKTVTINRSGPTARDCYNVRTYEACIANAPRCTLTAKQLDNYLLDRDACSKLFVFPGKP